MGYDSGYGDKDPDTFTGTGFTDSGSAVFWRQGADDGMGAAETADRASDTSSCNRAFDDTLVELQDMLQSQGFMVAAGIAVVAEHSIMHQFATGRPNEEDCAQLCAFGTLILERLEQIGVQPVTLPGNHPYVERHGGGLVPLVEQRCTGCGACAEHCPTGAISVEQPMQTDSIRCISCMGCIAVCPEQARYLPEQAVKMLSEKLGAICSVRKENQLFLPEQSS